MANIFKRLRDALGGGRRPEGQSGTDAASSDIGPGSLTPSRTASDGSAGASQPGSAITRPTEAGSTEHEGRVTGQ
jgi:hypothetical protein